MPKTRVAVIGCGTIANAVHIPFYAKNPDVELRYLCDILPERAEKAVKEYGCGKAVADYRAFLQDPELEAVSVCTHNDSHAAISIDFLRAGKDVLCEKPAARVLSEALEMQRVSHETGKILSIGLVNRYGDSVNRVRDMIAAGELGEVFHVYASFRAHRSIPGIGGDFTTKAISGGGALIDWGVHYLDLILYCCGEPRPLTASGEAFCKLGNPIEDYTFLEMWASRDKKLDGVYDVDDSVTGIIRTEGPVISFNGAWAQNIGVEETFIDFMGDKGGIRLQYCKDFVFYTAKGGALLEIKPQYSVKDFYKAEIDAFVRSVRTRQRNQSDIDYAIAGSKLLDAIYRSSELHREVTVG
ncbi:MAG: Gfo/Idh/MocA family oxidoreductase [Oscillospiraceae bacterium]|nr:Gfo/Idh/MocA family oxidoreductase [Oscillospiraceae bacterium]